MIFRKKNPPETILSIQMRNEDWLYNEEIWKKMAACNSVVLDLKGRIINRSELV